MKKRSINFTVNDEMRSIEVSPSKTLVRTLRDELGLTGTKVGCNQGVCGACTVLLDGDAVRGCLTLVGTCDGRKVTTVEGLSDNGELSAVQAAFAQSGAVQCGFCTSGMMIAAEALLKSNPRPSIDDIRIGIAGNICRCSGYRKIIDAIVMAADELNGDRNA